MARGERKIIIMLYGSYLKPGNILLLIFREKYKTDNAVQIC